MVNETDVVEAFFEQMEVTWRNEKAEKGNTAISTKNDYSLGWE